MFTLTAVTSLLGPSFTDIMIAGGTPELPFFYKLATPVVSAISYVFYAVFFASMFIELKTAKDGAPTEQLREVFA